METAEPSDQARTEPVRDMRIVPLRTPTLPPATHTNACVIGHEHLLIVDPAPFDATEQDVLLSVVRTLIRGGATADAILLTHHHPDHVGAAEWLSERIRAPIVAHAVTAALLSGQVRVDRTIDAEDVLDLGRDGRGDHLRLRVLHTPGHAPGHLVLQDLRDGTGAALVVGDMVAGVGTILIDPDDGDMSLYIQSLERLRDLNPGVLLPAHGPTIEEGRRWLERIIAHRLAREAKVLAALQRAEESTALDLLHYAYDDTPTALYPLAERSCLAHLKKLVADGQALALGDRFSARRPS